MAELVSLVVFRDACRLDPRPALDERVPEPSLEPASADYWRAREQAERTAAKKSRSAAARAVHQQLAQQYAERIRELERARPTLHLDLG